MDYALPESLVNKCDFIFDRNKNILSRRIRQKEGIWRDFKFPHGYLLSRLSCSCCLYRCRISLGNNFLGVPSESSTVAKKYTLMNGVIVNLVSNYVELVLSA